MILSRDYISFDVAECFYLNGFWREDSDYFHVTQDDVCIDGVSCKRGDVIRWNTKYGNPKDYSVIPCLTLTEAHRLIREEKGLFIEVTLGNFDSDEYPWYTWEIRDLMNEGETICVDNGDDKPLSSDYVLECGIRRALWIRNKKLDFLFSQLGKYFLVTDTIYFKLEGEENGTYGIAFFTSITGDCLYENHYLSREDLTDILYNLIEKYALGSSR